MTPPKVQLNVWRGGTKRWRFELIDLDADGAPFVLQPSDEVVLRAIYQDVEVMRKSRTGGDLIDVVTAEGVTALDLDLPPSETRTFNHGAVTRYEIEAWRGAIEITLQWGFISAAGGDNDDRP